VCYFVFLSLLLASGGAWFISRFAYRFGLLDIPNDRSSHNLPTPRGGGIGILAAFVVSSFLIALPVAFWVPATFLAFISFFDDKLRLTPKTRLFFQFCSAFIVVGYAIGFQSKPLELIIQQFPLFCFLSVFVVGTANFYNFMDGINGIAGITGVVGFAFLGLFSQMYVTMPSVTLSAFCVSGACIGFLPLNVPKAKVFMGDVGSVLLGFVFATYVVLLSETPSDFFLLAGFLSTFYADTLTTLYIRKRDGERLCHAHRRHLYQLFVNQMNTAHWKVSVCYGTVQTMIGLLLLTVRPLGLWPVLFFELFVIVCWCLVMMKIRRLVER